MKINGGEARVGTIIKYDGDIYKVVKSQHVKPGKGGAYNQVELKGVISGTKKNERLRSDEKVEKVVLEQKELTYLYFDGDFYVHMDDNTYDQISLAPSEIAEDQIPYLQEQMKVIVEFHEEKAIGIQLPQKVTVTVSETEAVIKGQTASSSYKPAILENGARVMVPPHIEAGTRIVINTETFEYSERAKD